jgi:hypothetical protein
MLFDRLHHAKQGVYLSKGFEDPSCKGTLHFRNALIVQCRLSLFSSVEFFLSQAFSVLRFFHPLEFSAQIHGASFDRSADRPITRQWRLVPYQIKTVLR